MNIRLLKSDKDISSRNIFFTLEKILLKPAYHVLEKNMLNKISFFSIASNDENFFLAEEMEEFHDYSGTWESAR